MNYELFSGNGLLPSRTNRHHGGAAARRAREPTDRIAGQASSAVAMPPPFTDQQ